MKFAATIILTALAAFPVVLATTHTLCYNYFMKKDGCVWSAADSRHRCNPNTGKPPNTKVGTFHQPSHHAKQKTLGRRYTTPPGTNTSFIIGSGEGICGNYTTNEPGVCLWVGPEQVYGNETKTAGWLNGAKTSNCGKQMYVQRQDDPSTVQYVPILDGCTFYTHDPALGCFEIALSNKTFHDLKPTKKELDQGYFDSLVWNFNDENGNKLSNAPV